MNSLQREGSQMPSLTDLEDSPCCQICCFIRITFITSSIFIDHSWDASTLQSWHLDLGKVAQLLLSLVYFLPILLLFSHFSYPVLSFLSVLFLKKIITNQLKYIFYSWEMIRKTSHIKMERTKILNKCDWNVSFFLF